MTHQQDERGDPLTRTHGVTAFQTPPTRRCSVPCRQTPPTRTHMLLALGAVPVVVKLVTEL